MHFFGWNTENKTKQISKYTGTYSLPKHTVNVSTGVGAVGHTDHEDAAPLALLVKGK